MRPVQEDQEPVVATEPVQPPPFIEAPPILVPPVEPPPPVIQEQVTFTGTGSEYFRIWIVNLALTIATLGVYSAWAKVRRLQFFYRHTRVAGAGFDYHGSPIAILKGRIVGLFLFGLYSSMGYAGTWLTLVIVVILAALLPWLLGRSLRFRLHNSSYRGLRFKFDGTAKQAYWIFLCMPLFTALSFFTLGPFWHHRLKRYQFANASYGRTRFTFDADLGKFYAAYIIAGVLVVVFFGLVVGSLIGLVAGQAAAGGPPSAEPPTSLIGIFIGVVMVFYVLAIVSAQAITGARIPNAVWNGTRLAGVWFTSSLNSWRLFRIMLTNLLATVLTLGLFRPFAQVRLARYFAGCMTMAHVSGLDGFVAAESEDVAAVGEETAELFDLDIGF